MKKCCIFDFDSTLVAIESLDFLIASLGQGQDSKKIEETTSLAMSGKLSFADSLRIRFEGLKIHKSDIAKVQNSICSEITKGMVEGLNKLKEQSDIYIISGGFLDIIYPVADKLGIARDHCFANDFVYDGNEIKGYNKENILANNGGKPIIVSKIIAGKNYQKIFMIGDGYTDLEVSKALPEVTFCGFGMHAEREAVKKEADNFFYSVEELVGFILG